MPQKCRAHQCLTQRENHILCSVISRATCLIYARQTTMSWFCTLGLASPMPTTCQSTGKNKEQGKHVVMTGSFSFPASGNQWLKDSVSKSWSPFLQIAPHGFFYVSYFLPWALFLSSNWQRARPGLLYVMTMIYLAHHDLWLHF